MFSCTTIPQLNVDYQLPAESGLLSGNRVYYSFKDARPGKVFLKGGAISDFKHFAGNIRLGVGQPGKQGIEVGYYRAGQLVDEGFRNRLKNLGIDLVPNPANGIPRLTIVLNELTLDLAKRKWKARMTYEAIFRKDQNTKLTQTITGESEKYKIFGTAEADETISELFTDVINRFNVVKLFK